MEKIIILINKNFTIFLKNKLLIVFSILFPIVFSTFFTLMFTNYEDINKIPIGVIDQDLSTLSRSVISNIYDNESVKIVSKDLKESLKLIKSNRIEAIFIIKSGFEDNIISSNYSESVELLYLDKSSIGPALGDIVASNIILDLAVYKAANSSEIYNSRYNLHAENIYEKTLAIANEIIADDIFEMSVDVNVQNPSNQIVSKYDIEDILKTNMLIGYSLVVLSLVILFSNAYLMESYNINATKQLISRGYSSLQLLISYLISIFISGSLIMIIQFSFILIIIKVSNWISILTIIFTLLLHILFLSNLILIFVSLLKSKIKYQSIIAPLLFLLGLLGGAFWSIEFLSKEFIWISYLSPIYWSMRIINGAMLELDIISIIYGYGIFIVILTATSSFIYNKYTKYIRYK